MKDKQKRKKERTWAEAARMVLENFSDAPMTPKQILHVIQTKGLKEMRSGTAPLACLVTMLHSQVRGDRVKNSIFFKLPGRMSLFTLKKNALQWTKTTSESESPTEPASSTVPPAPSSSTPAAGMVVAPVGPTEATEQESCDSTETTAAASGDNDASVDESSSSASCSTELQAPSTQPQTRLSRAAGQQGRTDTQQAQHVQHTQTRLSRSRQSGRQRKKAVMMPRVVLTPLKVNGEHVPSGPMKRSRGGVDVDFETPGSILVNTNIRALINVRTFSAFPTHSQQQLLQLLPEVDRQVKKKWSDLKLATKKRVAALRRSSTQTGGGQPDPSLTLTGTEETISPLIGSESISGISGGGGDTDALASEPEQNEPGTSGMASRSSPQSGPIEPDPPSQATEGEHVPSASCAGPRPAIITAEVLERQTQISRLLASVVSTPETINNTLKEMKENLKKKDLNKMFK